VPHQAKAIKKQEGALLAKELSKGWRFFPTYARA
jgi:hypothetical protein